MSHSYSRVAIHLIFSTKYRHRMITDEIRSELHAYLIGILRHLESPSIRTNSTPEHVHSLFLLSKKHALDHVVEEVKRGSSKWIKSKDPVFADFYWQLGYAAFSVGQTGIDRVIEYIDRQQEHHRTVSFEEEVRALFHRYGEPFDEHDFFE